MIVHETRQRNTAAWLAIGISLLSIMISFFAFNRTTEPGSPEIPKEVRSTPAQNFQQQAAVDNAIRRLEEIRENMSQDNTASRESQQREIQEIRLDLQNQFAGSTGNSQTFWKDIDIQLESLESSLREGSVEVLNVVDRALGALRTEIQIDD